MTQILIFAYFSYELAELFEFSGVISLFVCALIMSHYCWYSISVNSRKSLFQIAGLLDYISEILVFMSFGILLFSTGNFNKEDWNIVFIIIVICSILVSRLASVLILTNGLNIFRKEKIPFKFQIVLWWCGMRGIVTLLLALGMDSNSFRNRPLFLNTTYVVIFFTNIVIGLLTRPLVANLGVRSDVEGVNTLDPSATMSRVSIDTVKKERSAFARWWFIVDNKYLKKLFGGRKRMLDDKAKRSPASDDILGKIDVIGDDSTKAKQGPHHHQQQQQQSLNAAGAAAVAIMSESDVSDAEKIAGSQAGPSSSSSSSSGNNGGDVSDDVINDDDDDEEDEVIAPMSDSIRYVEISDTGDDEVQHHHRHHHHHHHGNGRHGSQGRTLSQPKKQKSYGSLSKYAKSLIMPSSHGNNESEEDESRSLMLIDRVGTENDDEKISLLK